MAKIFVHLLHLKCDISNLTGEAVCQQHRCIYFLCPAQQFVPQTTCRSAEAFHLSQHSIQSASSNSVVFCRRLTKQTEGVTVSFTQCHLLIEFL